MPTDLDQQIRRLIDTAAPITLDEIADSRKPSRHAGTAIWRAVLVGVATAAAVAGTVYGVRSASNGHAVSVASPPPTTVAPASLVGPPLPTCQWTGDTRDPSAPSTINAQGPPQGFWMACDPDTGRPVDWDPPVDTSSARRMVHRDPRGEWFGNDVGVQPNLDAQRSAAVEPPGRKVPPGPDRKTPAVEERNDRQHHLGLRRPRQGIALHPTLQGLPGLTTGSTT